MTLPDRKYILDQGDDGLELFDTLDAARRAFDDRVEFLGDDAGSDGWREDAEYSPVLYAAYPLRSHGLVKKTLEELLAAGEVELEEHTREAGHDWFGESEIQVFEDPEDTIGMLRAELESARAQLAAAAAAHAQLEAERKDAFDRVFNLTLALNDRDLAFAQARSRITVLMSLVDPNSEAAQPFAFMLDAIRREVVEGRATATAAQAKPKKP